MGNYESYTTKSTEDSTFANNKTAQEALSSILAENEKLKSENEKLKAENEEYRKLTDEVQELRNLAVKQSSLMDSLVQKEVKENLKAPDSQLQNINLDSHRLTSVIVSNTNKIRKNNMEINRLLLKDIGTERTDALVRYQLQNNHKLCNDTERFLKELNSSFLKELKALPSPEHESERRQRRVVLTRLANTFSNCLNEFQKAQTKASENDKNEVST